MVEIAAWRLARAVLGNRLKLRMLAQKPCDCLVKQREVQKAVARWREVEQACSRLSDVSIWILIVISGADCSGRCRRRFRK